MNRTLNELIENAVFGGEEAKTASVSTVAVQQEDSNPPASTVEDFGDVEKIASALEFLGRRGVASFLEKEAMHPENNAGQSHSPHTQKLEGPHKGAPPMSPGKASGLVENNAAKRPGGGAAQADTRGNESGTHHSALSGNESAIAFDKKTKTQRTSAALKKVLNASPYSDGKLKENLSNAAGKGDKNINKQAHDQAALRAELERRGLEGGI
tara:strand:- start:762 stop:1394 length:633 start_codon:yes stop_codon:yes gene_type:complete